MPFCTGCGLQSSPHVKFCTKCGKQKTEVSDGTTAVEVSSVTVAPTSEQAEYSYVYSSVGPPTSEQAVQQAVEWSNVGPHDTPSSLLSRANRYEARAAATKYWEDSGKTYGSTPNTSGVWMEAAVGFFAMHPVTGCCFAVRRHDADLLSGKITKVEKE